MIRFASMLCLGLSRSRDLGCGRYRYHSLLCGLMTGLDGQPVAMERFRGRPLIVEASGRWCGPCRDEIPELVKLRTEQGVDGIEVLGIAIEEADKLGAVRDLPMPTT